MLPPTSTVRLPLRVRIAIDAWARASHPEEACGLLVGRIAGTANDLETEVRSATRVRNRSQSSDRYELDPGDFIAADQRARASGYAIVGVWHSHASGAAVPSETDRRNAWTNFSYMIVSIGAHTSSAPSMRSWRLIGERFHEEELCS